MAVCCGARSSWRPGAAWWFGLRRHGSFLSSTGRLLLSVGRRPERNDCVTDFYAFMYLESSVGFGWSIVGDSEHKQWHRTKFLATANRKTEAFGATLQWHVNQISVLKMKSSSFKLIEVDQEEHHHHFVREEHANTPKQIGKKWIKRAQNQP